MLSARRGATLIELTIALGVASVVLGIVASISVREQRVFSDLANQVALSGQLREAVAILPTDLRVASPAAGDITPGEARDTSLQLRATLASAVLCDTSNGAFVLPPVANDVASFASGISSIQIGDTAWLYGATDSAAMWSPYRVASVGSAASGQCAAVGPMLDAVSRTRGRTTIVLDNGPSPAGAFIGHAVRFTRLLRYSLYHASDGAWYVGERDWNSATHRFNSIQPVAGPMISAARGGLQFQYLDSLGQSLSPPLSDASGVALVRIILRGETRDRARALAVARDIGKRTPDSTTIAVLLHNRR